MTFKKVLQNRAKKNNRGKVIGQFGTHQIIIKPLYTEKSMKMTEDMNKYSFQVNSRANKVDIKKAVEELFGVQVLAVNTMVMPHKGRMNRKTVRRSYKKAIITIPQDQKIELV